MTPTVTAPMPAARISTLDRPALMELAATEYERFAAMLAALAGDEWTRQTDCPAWDVREMAAHVLGMAEMAASIREGRRQQKVATKAGGDLLDALTALQVSERVAMNPLEITERFSVIGPKAARARRRTPGLIRRRKMPIPQAVGGESEIWTLGFLIDTVLTRDPWMHRVDIARATARPLTLTADHDGVLVSDVVVEWAQRHRRACSLTLTGVAGGTWTFGVGGPSLELDAIDFCRMLSGREIATDLLATQVPF